MEPEIASLFHAVISRGLELKERLRELAANGPVPQAAPVPAGGQAGGGGGPAAAVASPAAPAAAVAFPASADKIALLAEYHAALHGLLVMAHPARQFPDYLGDPPPVGADAEGPPLRAFPATRFLGLRYALACWLDEIMIDDQPWVAQWWTNNKLETRVFPPLNHRSRKFWEQARLSQGRATFDALEGYYLCVMLGFRGMYRGKPQELAAWRSEVQASLLAAFRRPWRRENPAPPRHVQEPLLGYRWHNRMILALAGVGSLAFVVGLVWFFTHVLAWG